jgi:hypothetical protein
MLFALRRGDHARKHDNLRTVQCSAILLALSLATAVGAQRPGSAPGDTVIDVDSTTLLQAGAANRADSSVRYQPESFAHFAMHTFGPVPLLRSSAMAAFDQWRRQPDDWFENKRGLRNRLDSRLGAEMLAHTIRFGFARVASEQSGKYRRCVCADFGARLEYALVTPFRVETPGGERLSAITPFGDVTSALVVTSVHPGGFSVSRGLISGASGLASASLTSVVREFWPWHWRPPGL